MGVGGIEIDNSVSDVDSISMTTTLEVLELTDTRIVSVHSLQFLPRLRKLKIDGTDVAHIGSLKEMFSLEVTCSLLHYPTGFPTPVI